MKGLKVITVFAILALLVSCKPEPRAIDYGEELCAFCKMTVVDKTYASEAVTDKGKVFVFDAIECLVHFADKNPEMEFAYQLVNHYGNPGVLQPAEHSYFLISENLPSPMGANLTAFNSYDSANAKKNELGGVVLEWSELGKELLTRPQSRIH